MSAQANQREQQDQGSLLDSAPVDLETQKKQVRDELETYLNSLERELNRFCGFMNDFMYRHAKKDEKLRDAHKTLKGTLDLSLALRDVTKKSKRRLRGM